MNRMQEVRLSLMNMELEKIKKKLESTPEDTRIQVRIKMKEEQIDRYIGGIKNV